MTVVVDDLLGDFGALLLVLTVATATFLAAVWFGLHMIAPRLQRAIDRPETEDEQDRDRDE